jgi:hypothetical protein
MILDGEYALEGDNPVGLISDLFVNSAFKRRPTASALASRDIFHAAIQLVWRFLIERDLGGMSVRA